MKNTFTFTTISTGIVDIFAKQDLKKFVVLCIERGYDFTVETITPYDDAKCTVVTVLDMSKEDMKIFDFHSFVMIETGAE